MNKRAVAERSSKSCWKRLRGEPRLHRRESKILSPKCEIELIQLEALSHAVQSNGDRIIRAAKLNRQGAADYLHDAHGTLIRMPI